jgi:HD-GYP domain-containing protein (c-di-GMP phosphodiesterase class II)
MGFDAAARNQMRRGALLHDLGKIAVPDHILRKPARLTAEEKAILATHPTVGYELLSPLNAMRSILPIVSHHHERLDGSGYPQGISGEDIPLEVRIVTVADVFDELTTTREEGAALDHSSALERLRAAFDALRQGVRNQWWDGEVVEQLCDAVSHEWSGVPS